MFRLRLASLTLASGLLITLSGCCSFCEDGRMFPRLFNRTSSSPAMMTGGPECECNRSGSAWTPGMPMPTGQGPFLMPSTATNPPGSIPIVNAPAAPPPHLFKVQQAPPTAFVPGN